MALQNIVREVVSIVSGEEVHTLFSVSSKKGMREMEIILERGSSMEYLLCAEGGIHVETDGVVGLYPDMLPVVIAHHIEEIEKIPEYREFVPRLDEFLARGYSPRQRPN